jgi:hypothetical protein
MQSSYLLLLKVYGWTEALLNGNWIRSFRICLETFDKWDFKKMLNFFEEETVSIAVQSCKHGIIQRHPVYRAEKGSG